MTSLMNGKYRWRTALRERLPDSLASLFPKGSDCGSHEWYKADDEDWRCYHCEAGRSTEIPWDGQEFEARSLEAQAMRVRAGVEEHQAVSH